jgi:exopolyphosphatase/guanosine-5'-triphosphate,3'-diphosphate pyrophosphatase
MAISHKHYNRHSAYLLRNADLPGFSQQEQEQLAVLALAHRGKFDVRVFADIPEIERPRLLRLICLLRLATLFKYVETLEQMPEFTIAASEQSIALGFPEDWLEQHPLTASELAQEQKVLEKMGMHLEVS